MKFFKNWRKKRWFENALSLCAGIILYLLLTHLGTISEVLKAICGYMLPVLTGMMISYIINPLVSLIENTVFGRMRSRRLARNLSVFISLLIVSTGIIAILIVLIPELWGSVYTFVRNLDVYTESVRNLLDETSSLAAEHNIDLSSITEIMDDFVGKLADFLRTNINTIINTSYNIGLGFFNGFIGFILAIYFLVDTRRIMAAGLKTFRLLLPEDRFQQTYEFWIHCNRILKRYVIGDLLDGLIVGIANFIFMSIARMPYAMLLSVVVGVANLAPTFGPVFGGAIGAFILVWTSPWNALWFLVFTLILQTIDGYILKPKLFGNTLGVSSLWILITIVVGGRVFGMFGVLLAIPTAAIVDFIYHQWVLKMEKMKTSEEIERKKRLMNDDEYDG